jgi:hypothetical protein
MIKQGRRAVGVDIQTNRKTDTTENRHTDKIAERRDKYPTTLL